MRRPPRQEQVREQELELERHLPSRPSARSAAVLLCKPPRLLGPASPAALPPCCLTAATSCYRQSHAAQPRPAACAWLSSPAAPTSCSQSQARSHASAAPPAPLVSALAAAAELHTEAQRLTLRKQAQRPTPQLVVLGQVQELVRVQVLPAVQQLPRLHHRLPRVLLMQAQQQMIRRLPAPRAQWTARAQHLPRL